MLRFCKKLWHHPPIPQDLGNTMPFFNDEGASSPTATVSDSVKGTRRPLPLHQNGTGGEEARRDVRGRQKRGHMMGGTIGSETRNPSG